MTVDLELAKVLREIRDACIETLLPEEALDLILELAVYNPDSER